MPTEPGNFDQDTVIQMIAQRQRKHIFVVNESPEFLDFVRQLLQEERFNVTTTNFVPETFAQIRVAEPDLIIVDLGVRHHHGQDLIARLAQDQHAWDIPVIVTSTSQHLLDQAAAIQSEHSGDQRYIIKPFDIDDLMATITSMLGAA